MPKYNIHINYVMKLMLKIDKLQIYQNAHMTGLHTYSLANVNTQLEVKFDKDDPKSSLTDQDFLLCIINKNLICVFS